MSGYPQARTGPYLYPARTVLLPAAWLVRAAVVLAVIVAILTFIAAMYGWRDGYSQGFRAGVQAAQLKGTK